MIQKEREREIFSRKMQAACVQQPASSFMENLQVELSQICSCKCQGKASEEQISNRVPTTTGWGRKKHKKVIQEVQRPVQALPSLPARGHPIATEGNLESGQSLCAWYYGKFDFYWAEVQQGDSDKTSQAHEERQRFPRSYVSEEDRAHSTAVICMVLPICVL